jgi:hypothetical protein
VRNEKEVKPDEAKKVKQNERKEAKETMRNKQNKYFEAI